MSIHQNVFFQKIFFEIGADVNIRVTVVHYGSVLSPHLFKNCDVVTVFQQDGATSYFRNQNHMI